ncbi:MAG: hypothetical protein RDA78_15620 [Roseibium sp.]|uniref:hypothetical protein n=1 Tax=Roseibium sp. TaxID=1936156 RepID=UPI003D9C0E45
MAREEYRQVHNGKQIAMIGFAYRNGMRSDMPSWYTAFARSVSPTKEIEFHYESLQPDLAPKHMQQKTRMVTDDQYKSFCKIFCDEVNRICGQSYFEHEDSDVLDDNTLYEAYRQGDDPLVAAAMYCHENGLNHETFASYESYRAAFANEFERLVSNPSEATIRLSAVDDTKVHASFLAGTHPRLAAAGYHEIVN